MVKLSNILVCYITLQDEHFDIWHMSVRHFYEKLGFCLLGAIARSGNDVMGPYLDML